MLPQEHYFENILFNYMSGKSYSEAIIDKSNTQDLSKEEIEAIKMCALYVIDNICDWNKDILNYILNL